MVKKLLFVDPMIGLLPWEVATEPVDRINIRLMTGSMRPKWLTHKKVENC